MACPLLVSSRMLGFDRSISHPGALVFVTGGTVMAAEMAASRLVAPYFGSSTPVWGALVTLVMVSLALGAEVGGRLADRTRRADQLLAALAGAALWLAGTPFAARPLLARAAAALREGQPAVLVLTLAALTLLALVPLAVLGAVAPFAARLTPSRGTTPWDDGRGGAYGHISALGTAGSVAGTLLSVFVVLPAVGTAHTMIGFALLLALAATLGASLVVRTAVVGAIGLGLALSPRVVATVPGVTIARESPYALVQVQMKPSGAKRLVFDEGFAAQSVYTPGKLTHGEVFDHYLLAPWMGAEVKTAPKILLLGLGAGTSARSFRALFPRASIVGVELDPVVAELARTEFDLPADVEVHVGDARAHLAEESRKFDVIVVDAFRFPYVPFHLLTEELAATARDHLAPGGVLVMNLGRWKEERAIVDLGARTMSRSFASAWLADAHTPSNTILYAGDGPLPERLAARLTDLPPELRGFGARVAGELTPAPRGGPTFTDDHAPVEAMTDAIVLRSLASLRR